MSEGALTIGADSVILYANQAFARMVQCPLEQVLGMIPGMHRLPQDVRVDERAVARTEAIIRSMTPAERRTPGMINGSRPKRIVTGSGTTVQDVNRVLKQFEQMHKMMKTLGKGGRAGKMIRQMKLPSGF